MHWKIQQQQKQQKKTNSPRMNRFFLRFWNCNLINEKCAMRVPDALRSADTISCRCLPGNCTSITKEWEWHRPELHATPSSFVFFSCVCVRFGYKLKNPKTKISQNSNKLLAFEMKTPKFAPTVMVFVEPTNIYIYVCSTNVPRACRAMHFGLHEIRFRSSASNIFILVLCCIYFAFSRCVVFFVLHTLPLGRTRTHCGSDRKIPLYLDGR